MAINISSTPAAHATMVGNYSASADAVKAAVARLVYSAFGKREMLSARVGNKAGWYVQPDPRVAPTATAEGTVMTSANAGALVRSVITATIQKFEDAIVDSEMFYITNPFDFYQQNREWVIQSATQSLDVFVRDTIQADATIVKLFANGKATGTIALTDLATLDDMVKLRTALVGSKAPVYQLMGKQVYVAIVGPATHGQLLRNQAYRDATVMYVNGETIPDGLVRMVAGFAFLETANIGTATHNSISCERNYVFGDGGYGVTALPVLTGSAGSLEIGNGPALPAATATEAELNFLATSFRISMVGFGETGDKGDINNTTRAMGYVAYFGASTLKPSYMREFIAPVA